MNDEQITPEYVASHGYQETEHIGFVKALGGDHEPEIHIGYWPFNEARVSIRVDGVYIGTNVRTEGDLQILERLLIGAPVDYDDVQYVDQDEWAGAVERSKKR